MVLGDPAEAKSEAASPKVAKALLIKQVVSRRKTQALEDGVPRLVAMNVELPE